MDRKSDRACCSNRFVERRGGRHMAMIHRDEPSGVPQAPADLPLSSKAENHRQTEASSALADAAASARAS